MPWRKAGPQTAPLLAAGPFAFIRPSSRPPAQPPPPLAALVPAAAKPAHGMYDFYSWRVQLSTWWWFGLAGLIGGLTSVPGPPIMVWVSVHAKRLDFDAWRGSSAIMRTVMNVARLGVLLAHQRNRQELRHTSPLALSMVLGGAMGRSGITWAA